MPYAVNGEVHIYYEVEGKGPPVVLLHGGFGDSDTWKEAGYVDSLKNGYQLIMKDDRAHGKSNRNYNPDEYTLSNIARDTIVVLNETGIDETTILGVSGGGLQALAVAALYPERVNSLIIFGMSPNFSGSAANKQILQLSNLGPEALIEFMESSMPGMSVTDATKKRVRATDFKSLAATMSQPQNVDIGKALPKMKIPILVMVGEEDNFFNHKMLRDEYGITPNLTFVTIPGIGHSMERIDLILPHIQEFLARVPNKGA